jgi:hypothetical protein
MAVLLLADVNDGQLATDAVAKALAAVKGLGEVHLLVAGQASAAAAAEAAKLAARPRCCTPMTPPMTMAWPNPPPR